MARPNLTDERIGDLIRMGKTVTSASRRPSEKGKHREWDFDLTSDDGTRFSVFVRQNTMLDDAFSCGLCWLPPSGEQVILARYNGGSHPHVNKIEKIKLPMCCHVHRATERHMKIGRSEGYAEPTDVYSDIDGALRALVDECHISGIDGLPGKTIENNPRQLALKWKN
jgi:hypothetical protein